MSLEQIDILTQKRCDMAYCPGCSHGSVLESLAAAMCKLELPPEKMCLVTDIGCVGLADQYFACHTFHGLHGRSLTYAEGIRRARPDLLTVVLIGDGGCGIGTAHLVHSARRGVPIKVVVCNNFNFGMTGGQSSPTTPPAAVTSTSRAGATERPMDICGTVLANGAHHVARFSAMDRDCTTRIEAALRSPGFALLDIWELCVAYFVEKNKVRPATIHEMSERLGLPFGLLRDDRHATEPKPVRTAAVPRALRPEQTRVGPLAWHGRQEIWIAGSAGQHIRTAAGIFGEIATACGLFVAQDDDFPITVRRGHSVSKLVISGRPIRYTGSDAPSVMILLSEDGVKRVSPLDRFADAPRVFSVPGLAGNGVPGEAEIINVAAMGRTVGRENVALAALVSALLACGMVEAKELYDAAESVLHGKHRDSHLTALRLAAESRGDLTKRTKSVEASP